MRESRKHIRSDRLDEIDQNGGSSSLPFAPRRPGSLRLGASLILGAVASRTFGIIDFLYAFSADFAIGITHMTIRRNREKQRKNRGQISRDVCIIRSRF